MHILHIASGDFFSTYGGGQIYVHNICKQQASYLGIKISVLSFVEKKHIPPPTYFGCTIYEESDFSEDYLYSVIEHIKPDIIHAHSHKAQICRIGKSLAIPIIVTAHHGGIVCPAGTLLNIKDEICQTTVCHENCLKCCLRNIRSGLNRFPLMNRIPRELYIQIGKWLDKLPFIPFITPIAGVALSIKKKQEEWQTIGNDCTLMIAPSVAIKKAMVRNGLNEEKIQIIPHGIPLPKNIAPFPSTKKGIKFFYVGRICYVKGLHILLEAFHETNNNRIELHIIGGAANKGEKRYENLLKKKYQNDSRIIWHGKIQPEHIFDTINNFHISSSSSYLEAFGLNIAESLALGRPVLSTLNGGAQMQIADGINGWLVPSNNIKAMKAKIEEIVSLSGIQLKKMSAASTAISIDQHCNQLISIYKDILNHRTKA